MKVLFAVSNEEISESIVKKFQREYKEIISYKNVYYFNAILKELQKDKSYDRVVISEELEAFTNTQYSQIDKFIFEKLDSISDEASNAQGDDIPIILICSDRRQKSEEMLVKLFGIGIYDALVGNDRSVDNVCNLLKKPRLKKEAKIYYKIDSDDVSYQAENENDVSEVEIQNILAHYKRLGKDERKYVESFDNIAAQYNDVQLRIISSFLPLNVRAVLEEQSEKYQELITHNHKVSDTLRKQNTPREEKTVPGTSETFLGRKNRDMELSKPVVIPSSVKMSGVQKLSKFKSEVKPIEDIEDEEDDIEETNSSYQEKYNEPDEFDDILGGINDNDTTSTIDSLDMDDEREEDTISPISMLDDDEEDDDNTLSPISMLDDEEDEEENSYEEDDTLDTIQPVVEEAKRGRGRPRKYPAPTPEELNKPKRGRGRPRKNPIQEENDFEDNMTLPGFDNVEEEKEETILPGFDDVQEEQEEQDNTILPGFDDVQEEESEEDTMLPGFDDVQDEQEEQDDTILPGFDNVQEEPQQNRYEERPVETRYNEVRPELQRMETPRYESSYNPISSIQAQSAENRRNMDLQETQETERVYDDVDISGLLTSEKKIACFVGTSKNGTSFVVNNLAEITAQMGIDTAILDVTKNRNSYYIYTKNEEALRNVAMNSVNSLLQGQAQGIQVGRNLTVYTSLPDETEGIENAGTILKSLLVKHSLVLIDCDFDTPINYFEKAQEIYLVQTYDILTIQPLTAFLRELKAKNVLKENKLKVVINKALKVRGVNEKVIIGGMAYYNDPAMSFMTELFDKNTIRFITIPFNEETYTKYLDGIINCEVSTRGYPKNIVQILHELANMVYPLVSGKGAYAPRRETFTPSINSTLDQMKRRY